MSEPYIPPPPSSGPPSGGPGGPVPPPPPPPVAGPGPAARHPSGRAGGRRSLLSRLGVGVVTAISLVAFNNDDSDDGSDVTLPDVERDVDRSGWVLETPSGWVAVDVPGVEAAWSVGDGSAAFGNNVTVVVEKSPMSNLDAYLDYTAELSDVALGAATTVVSSDIVPGSDGELGRLELTSAGDEPLHVLMYVMETKEGFVNATYAATLDTYDGQVDDIEAVLKTLHGA